MGLSIRRCEWGAGLKDDAVNSGGGELITVDEEMKVWIVTQIFYVTGAFCCFQNVTVSTMRIMSLLIFYINLV